MNDTLQIFKENIFENELSKTETYWIDQIEFKIEDHDLIICVNSEFVKSSIEKKVFQKILDVVNKTSELNDCVFVLDPNKKSIDSFTLENTEHKEEEINISNEEDSVLEVDMSVFDNLLVGSSNNLAVTAAKNVVQNPGTRFNPLFIHGLKNSFVKNYGRIIKVILLHRF